MSKKALLVNGICGRCADRSCNEVVSSPKKSRANFVCARCGSKLSREGEKLHGRFFGLRRIEEAVKEILLSLQEEFGIDPKDENFKDTPKRVARAYYEIFEGMSDTEEEIKHILGTAYKEKYDEMIVVGPVETFAVCPHHLLPVEVIAFVGYIPNGQMLGISKLARLVQVLSSRPILQEKLTIDVTDKLMTVLKAKGAACVIRARHMCMCMRGAKERHAWTTTSSMVGALLKKPEARAEFLQLVKFGNGK